MVMQHGIGMYISSADLINNSASDYLTYSLGGRYEWLSFWLGSDSDWSHYEDSGSFRLIIRCDGDVYFDSGYQDYTYSEYVELYVGGIERLEIELREIKGKTHTLNIVMGEFTLSAEN
jgi:hypothetical protein